LRETLAAAVLELAGWRPGVPLVDPTCGSGTLAIEAALLARGRAPGSARGFAFEAWPICDAATWRGLKDAARAAEHQTKTPILASDIDADAIALARANATRAGLFDDIVFTTSDLAALRLPEGEPGIVVCNPPYGVRLRPERVVNIYRELGRLVRSRPGWRLAVLTGDERLARAAGVSRACHSLSNGGIRVGLYII
jgi:putative N6-adenine-specific DNA methylase